jgi:hypothetical protein
MIFRVILWYLVFGTLLLILGDLVFRFLQKKTHSTGGPQAVRLAAIFHLVPVLGYAVFWLYMLKVTAGVIFSCIVFLAVAISGVYQLCRYKKLLFLDNRESIMQAILMVCVPSIFLLTIAVPLNLPKNTDLQKILDFFEAKTPMRGSPDYLIQWLYSQNESPWNHPLCPHRTSIADRPPVIAGTTYLLKTPDWFLQTNEKKLELSFFLGIAIFCCVGWIPAFWAILRSQGVSFRKCAFLIVLLGFSSPFIFFYTAFPWPKMLGGTFMLAAYLLVDSDFKAKDIFGRLTIPIAAIFVGFSLLCYLINAIAIPFLLIYFLRKRNIRLRDTVVCGLIVLGVIASWYVPKKKYEGPNSWVGRLLMADSSNEQLFFSSKSDFEAIRESYKNLSMREILEAKYILLKNSLPPLKYTKNDLVDAQTLFTSQGFVLIAATALGLLFCSRKSPFCRFYIQKFLFYIFMLLSAYVILILISFNATPQQGLFPISITLLYILALLMGASFLPEKCLMAAAGAAFVLWLYLYLDNPALIITGGATIFLAALRIPYLFKNGDASSVSCAESLPQHGIT